MRVPSVITRPPITACLISGRPDRQLEISSNRFWNVRAAISRNAMGAVIRNHHCNVLSVPSTIWKFDADSAAARAVVTITITEKANHSTASSIRQANCAGRGIRLRNSEKLRWVRSATL